VGIFCQLYASGENIIELLNTAAPGFFRICEDLLADDVLLSMSRLRDPKQTFGKDNLTLERLVHSIDATRYPQLRLDVERLLSDVRAKSAFVKAQRDTRIAHADLSTKFVLAPGQMRESGLSAHACVRRRNRTLMKKTSTSKSREKHSGDMPPEYDFDYTKAKPNRFAGRIAKDRLVVSLDPEVSKVFSDSESVNAALRQLIPTLPKNTKREARK
jgi:hypothetical protein